MLAAVHMSRNGKDTLIRLCTLHALPSALSWPAKVAASPSVPVPVCLGRPCGDGQYCGLKGWTGDGAGARGWGSFAYAGWAHADICGAASGFSRLTKSVKRPRLTRSKTMFIAMLRVDAMAGLKRAKIDLSLSCSPWVYYLESQSLHRLLHRLRTQF